MKLALTLGAFLPILGCTTAIKTEGQIKVSHLPPTAKDIVAAVMASSQLPLSDPSCKGFGTETGDKTIGRYLAGYLAELSSQEDRNGVTTSVGRGAQEGEAVYLCRMMIRHAKGEEVWSWGLEFAVKQSDGAMVANSIRCVGAG